MIERARIVLCASEGLKGLEIAERVGCSEAEPNMGYAVSRSAAVTAAGSAASDEQQ